jgi:hypothetical protein
MITGSAGTGRGRQAHFLWLIAPAILLPYVYAWHLGDLRQQTVPFVAAFGAAFLIYAAVCIWALRPKAGGLGPAELAGIFIAAGAVQFTLISTRPTLSDDMYRYVWDGRVQAHGISPYRYPPDAPELAGLRDGALWPLINRKSAVTVYPPAAEAAFALLWRLSPDSVRLFQGAMALSALAAGLLLLGLLRDLGRAPSRVLIYLWSPLLAFEAAHAAHVDALALPLLVGAWWARARERDGLTGVLLGLATAVKLYPILLLPALWRPRDPHGRWRLPAAFALTLAVCYARYVLGSGASVLGYLPQYVGERFNMGLAGLLARLIEGPLFDPTKILPTNRLLDGLTALVLVALAAWMVCRPAPDASIALRRCAWLMGAYTLLTPALFPWYMLWVLPLAALFIEPGEGMGLHLDAWTGWWLFTGLVGLSYLFFVHWRPVPVALWAEFVPLWALLILDLLWRRRGLFLLGWLPRARTGQTAVGESLEVK